MVEDEISFIKEFFHIKWHLLIIFLVYSIPLYLPPVEKNIEDLIKILEKKS